MEADMDGPGFGSVMRRLEEGRQLPWRLVKYGTWNKLANKLDLPSPVTNNDWKMLAEHLDFSTENILLLENSKKPSSTEALFTNYLPKKNASVNSVAKALKQMNRDDALQILLDAVPDIETRFEKELMKPSMEAVEGDDPCVTNMTQGGCRCLGSPTSLTCSNQHGTGSCSPCHPHPHHHPQLQCSMASGGCCCPHVGNAHCHTPPVPYSPLMHPQSQRSHMSFNYNISPEPNYKMHGSGGREYYNPASSSPHNGSRPLLLQHPHPQALSGPHMPQRQYSDLHAPYSRGIHDSMTVHQDAESHLHRGFHSFSANNESMDLDVGRREEPASLPTAIARGEGLVSMDVGEDTPSTSLEELSSSDSSSRLPALNVARQVSEECNAKQPFVNTATSPNSRLYSEGSEDMANWAAKARLATGTGSQKDNPSSLKQLETLSNLPSYYKPDPKYTTMVAEQKIEESNANPRGNGTRQVKRERGEANPSCLFSVESNRSGTSSSSGKSRTPVGAETFPMRVKPQTGGATLEQVRSRQPGVLTKTTSVPIDMKVEEFKKAFRHIKVFVTYSSDSKHHRTQVLSLCHCLDRNGFSCCVDVSSHQDSPDQIQTSRDWCSRKFKEADFVVVCLSSAYLRDIQGAEKNGRSHGAGSRASKGTLQAAYIFHLMEEEYHTTGRCSRFVPLYMEGASCDAGPSWLTSHLTYHWPRQYKDLLWMLTKPEDRIKQRSRTSPQKGHLALKVNGVH